MNSFLLHSNEPTIDYLLHRLTIDHGTQWDASRNYDAIIYWGLPQQKEHRASFVLNSLEPLKRSQDQQTQRKLLQLHGLNVPDRPTAIADYPYYFKIPVFHLSALSVFRLKNHTIFAPFERLRRMNTSCEEIGIGDNYHVRRVMREAIRAVYAVGLDHAMVSIGVLSNGKIVIHELDPAPELDERLGQLYAQAMNNFENEYRNEMNRQLPPLLGTDPEFILCHPSGKVVSASKYMERKGEVGCDAIVLSGHRKIFPLAELRPAPSSDPKQLFIHLYRAMRKAEKLVHNRQLEWLAGGMPKSGFALGGHIHFSNIWLNSRLLRALDNYLALPLLLIEEAAAVNRRPRYGFLGDFRRQFHGGFEYRTLPSWIVTPRITLGVFSLARLIADHYKLLHNLPLNGYEQQRYYYEGNKAKLHGKAMEMWAELERLSAYSEYEAYLKPMKQQIMRMESWNEQLDFRRFWKIPPYDRKTGASKQIMI